MLAIHAYWVSMPVLSRLILSLTIMCVAVPASAQQREVPYWASLRSGEVNMRVGPSEDYPVEWHYRRVGLPVKVVRLHEGWRLVVDAEGARGWILSRLLSPERSALVIGDGLADMRAGPSGSADLRWQLQPGVVGVMGECKDGWCHINVKGHRGWVLADRLWGDGSP